MNTEMPKEAPATSAAPTIQAGEAARKPKDLPRVKSETIVRHGHVV